MESLQASIQSETNALQRTQSQLQSLQEAHQTMNTPTQLVQYSTNVQLLAQLKQERVELEKRN